MADSTALGKEQALLIRLAQEKRLAELVDIQLRAAQKAKAGAAKVPTSKADVADTKTLTMRMISNPVTPAAPTSWERPRRGRP